MTVLHASYAHTLLSNSRFITVDDCASLQPMGPKEGGYHYAFCINSGSNQNLFQRIYAEDGRHDFVLGARVAGPNVFLNAYAVRGQTQGPHHRWATGALFDSIQSSSLFAITEHRGGSGTGHGWTGVSHVGWNLRSPSFIWKELAEWEGDGPFPR